jgi:methionyl-tRNA formyltransferase
LRILFMGSPEIAVPFLAMLTQQEEVVGVITQPDQPAGRGYKLKPPAVKETALSMGLEIHQPEKLKNNDNFRELLKNLNPDLGVIIAYGKILPAGILETPKTGSINIHFSVLPKYRGPAPIQWALINGEEETGVTIFWLNEKVDAGEIIWQEKIKIVPEDDYYSLSAKLVKTGLAGLKQTLELIKKGQAPRISQNPAEVSYAPLVHKTDALIKWSKSAWEIHNLIRALVAWPTAYTVCRTDSGKNKLLKILEARINPGIPADQEVKGKPGEILGITREGMTVKCADSSLLIKKVKLEGAKEMSSYDFTLGHKIKTGEILGP